MRSADRMQLSPQTAAFAFFALLVMGSAQWRRGRIRRAVRDLPTRMQRLLGPEPLFTPPSEGELPEGLRRYAALHHRTRWVQRAIWALAFLWLGYTLYSVLKGTPQ